MLSIDHAITYPVDPNIEMRVLGWIIVTGLLTLPMWYYAFLILKALRVHYRSQSELERESHRPSNGCSELGCNVCLLERIRGERIHIRAPGVSAPIFRPMAGRQRRDEMDDFGDLLVSHTSLSDLASVPKTPPLRSVIFVNQIPAEPFSTRSTICVGSMPALCAPISHPDTPTHDPVTPPVAIRPSSYPTRSPPSCNRDESMDNDLGVNTPALFDPSSNPFMISSDTVTPLSPSPEPTFGRRFGASKTNAPALMIYDHALTFNEVKVARTALGRNAEELALSRLSNTPLVRASRTGKENQGWMRCPV
ncbi:hypothetical protein HGRIS_010793 [Hohenbuehelia grisea]|uniref:Uncharacterized protein n=1 Tax=Hohenbuehelia grisea TaxID=104357 RepID=A0ABR3IY57_9AGAR